MTAKKGALHHNWKGSKVGYRALHDWITRHKTKPELCEECQKQPPMDLANISGLYHRDINDYRYLCRSCHMILDGRLERLQIANKKWRNRK